MVKVRICILTPDASSRGGYIEEFADGIEMSAVPRIGEEISYALTDETRLSRETRNRVGAGKWIFKVKNVRWDFQDPDVVDVFLLRD